MVTSLISKIKQLPFDDAFRIKATEQLLEKLYNMGVINSKENIEVAEKLAVSAFCRRRLAVLLCSLKFSETMKEAVTFIEQGHVRVGTEVVTEPAFLVTRQLEDHVGWVDTSSIKKKILEYNDKFDDYDILNWTHSFRMFIGKGKAKASLSVWMDAGGCGWAWISVVFCLLI